MKSNIKFSVSLDSNHLVELIKLFVDSTLNQIKVSISDISKLNHVVKSFEQDGLMELVKIHFHKKSEFLLFMTAL